MQRWVAMSICLITLAVSGRVEADDKADELARLAGEYTAEYSMRTGQAPAEKAALIGLTLKISKDDWSQNYRGDVAPYKITLDLTDDLKAMRLDHQKVKAVRNCSYVLKGDTLTVTEQLGEPGEVAVVIWKRRREPIN